MEDRLGQFISHARSKGMDHATIRLLLLSAGWKEREIATAMATEGLDLPVPQPAGVGSARDAFLYSLMFTALYVVVVSAINLYYDSLNYAFPDPAWPVWYTQGALESVRWSLAAILIAFPLFVFLTVFLGRELVADAEKQNSPVRKWLTYLTLFLAASIMMCDLITLLYYFLEGGLTSRFVLKAIVLLVIAAVVFCYYFLSLRSAAEGNASRASRRALAAVAILLVVGALAQGFALAGSPLTARLARLDDRRVEDLRAIHHAVQAMATKTENGSIKLTRPLPKSLQEIAAYQQTRASARELKLSDPQSGDPYSFRVTGEKTYELCASFSLPRDENTDLFWNHPAGKHCFSFRVESPP